MTPRAVLDASVAVHVVLGSSLAPELFALVEETAAVMAPGLYSSEVANALWKYVAAKELSRDEAGEALTEALSLVDTFVADQDLVVEALWAAESYRHPVDDMLYAVLARRYGAVVFTLDKRLRRVLTELGLRVRPR